jgi:DNA uptake protein ComE-like DNA-binding protein
MPTAAERHALVFLAGVVILGGAVRTWHGHRDGLWAMVSGLSVGVSNVGNESVGDQLAAVDGARSQRKSKRGAGKSRATVAASDQADANAISTARAARGTFAKGARAAGPAPMIDVDAATPAELEQLPRVGPALAVRIVANRDSFGAFGSLDELSAVRGIGESLERALTPLVTFSGRPTGLRKEAIERRSTLKKVPRVRSRRAKREF